MGSMQNTTYAWTQTSAWGMQLFSALHVDAIHVRSSWGSRGSRASICLSSRNTHRTTSVYCSRVGKGLMIKKICQLLPVTDDNETGVRDLILCILVAMDAWLLLIVQVGEVGAVGTTDKVAMGYYLVKWLSKAYTLQADTEGMSGMIVARSMMGDALYFNRVECAPYWYLQSGEMTVVEVRHVLRTCLKMEEVSTRNKLPQACNRLDATQKKACKIASQDHEAIMEEAR
jgi:hypothetical protein